MVVVVVGGGGGGGGGDCMQCSVDSRDFQEIVGSYSSNCLVWYTNNTVTYAKFGVTVEDICIRLYKNLLLVT